MGVTLAGAVVRSWSKNGPLAWLLLPVAALYGALAAVRRALYRWKWIPSRSVDACVIVVGNVVAGGAGKTPTVISLVRHLQAQGHRVGVVSRGFGRRNQGCQAVDAASTAQDVGDEPLLIQSVTGVPVVVGRDRWQAAHALLARHTEVEVIVVTMVCNTTACTGTWKFAFSTTAAAATDGCSLPAPCGNLGRAGALKRQGKARSNCWSSKPVAPHRPVNTAHEGHCRAWPKTAKAPRSPWPN